MPGRNHLTIWLLILVTAVLGVTAVNAHQSAALDVDMTVTDTTVHNESLEALTLELHNREPTATTVLVRVWGLNDHRQHIWAGTNGTEQFTLQPGETRRIRVQRQKFELSTDPSNPVMVALTTPQGVERTHVIIRPQAP